MISQDFTNRFIQKYIVRRESSLLNQDIDTHTARLRDLIEGKSFLITGGAGTIGSSYLKSILPFHPAKITVVDYNENGLTELVRDLRSTPGLKLPVHFLTYPFDFGSPVFRKLMNQDHFNVIASFAAHKHVRSEKDLLAVEAMITNNVYNMDALLEAAVEHQPQHVFAVSTDKASNPVNIMGGSKKIMEHLIMAYADKIKVTTARFANVAFSNGSLLDGFNKRIQMGQPISAPSDVRRYFVTPEESGQICMLASLLGESRDIFFPKLAVTEMMTFSEIADRYLFELGYKSDESASEEEAREKSNAWTPQSKSYPVFYFSSDTTGEKPYEEFFTDSEETDLQSFHALGIVKGIPQFSVEDMKNQITVLKVIFNKPDATKEMIVSAMKNIMPEFDHMEKGRNLDSKM